MHNIKSKFCCPNILFIFILQICEHLETELIDRKFGSETENLPFKLSTLSKGPFYQPITEQWQKEKCHQLGVPFETYFEQQPTLAGSLLSQFIPRQTEEIGMDGNCFSGAYQI